MKHPAPDSFGAASPVLRHVFRAFTGEPRGQYLQWLTIPQCSTPAPLVPNYFVVRPEFRSQSGSFFGGHAFAVESERGGPPLILTALHVMDELIRSQGVDCRSDNGSYTGRELPAIVKSVTLYDVFAAKWMFAELGVATSMLVLPNARLGDKEPYSQRDIAAFRADAATRISPAKLAAQPPQPGEPVWLAASSGQGTSKRPMQAVVVEQTAQTLIFRFSAPPVSRYSSGAPLLNNKGEVVGTNAGGGVLENQHLGHGSHVISMRRHLGWGPARNPGIA
ncbi:MAG TPA: trypsin-like peptidase domain-containing protein [Bryobacteraceae bacterium]|nr:trypsin-like peptidase domain-containing protein [Bryobacteraceae bacterium]